jgi:hypothetical protein
VTGVRVPDGTVLVWAVEDDDEDGGLVGLFTTPALAQAATGGRPNYTVYPRLLFSRPERKVEFVQREVVLRYHWRDGWWVVRDVVAVLDDYLESEYPLAHGDPEITSWNRRFSQGLVRAVVAGRDREGEVRAAVQAELDARWPNRLLADPDAAVIM